MAIGKALVLVGIAATILGSIMIVSDRVQEERALRMLYKQWQQQHNKPTLSEEEDIYRFNVFKRNYEIVERHNAEADAENDATAVRLSLNLFADLTLAEFKAQYMGRKNKPVVKGTEKYVKQGVAVPDQVDWRTKNVVTDVKNQGQCGSCWAFSAVAGLEGAYALKAGSLQSLSEQQIVDCSKNGGNEGCNGGDLPPAFDYVVKNGIEPESAYPYTARDGKCHYDKSKVVFTPSKYVEVTENDGDAIAEAVAQQPVPVCIEADSSAFQFYTSGVLTSKSCGTELDHCVLIAGYNASSAAGDKPYWIVKNSWGRSWGSKGYILILKESKGKGICGINEEAVYPVA